MSAQTQRLHPPFYDKRTQRVNSPFSLPAPKTQEKKYLCLLGTVDSVCAPLYDPPLAFTIPQAEVSHMNERNKLLARALYSCVPHVQGSDDYEDDFEDSDFQDGDFDDFEDEDGFDDDDDFEDDDFEYEDEDNDLDFDE
ncbi:hypothetical protein [Treponema pallidum]|uniref:Uncharacterized protein TP_0370 n=2 Tax=Treponema pallidum subsp. pallidum TaxID=161 RepID=Y370_TREPA|nr:hypothetical protein [Treponema pallidum]O83385.1 RecName: Full=Uncharacterized protein TP_0370 [Treponema pallidum subsp. pallidum str. Nichols]AAC65361.1 predicted coding region TP0370 [Treponema pallidum subsp. pallidum str. Nichols]ACD70796.1 hypothetical protein TPASS_0370 [Treponema pallidum subsp. pallidum SS14]AFU66378.1 hypothetical protein TPAMA_0370 [Treponema pallidum subsp. pallidum str. Mexico A]AGN75567.1 hypothetical protein TPANIC_0370 [Treponema pallidum subsp. pallidum st